MERSELLSQNHSVACCFTLGRFLTLSEPSFPCPCDLLHKLGRDGSILFAFYSARQIPQTLLARSPASPAQPSTHLSPAGQAWLNVRGALTPAVTTRWRHWILVGAQPSSHSQLMLDSTDCQNQSSNLFSKNTNPPMWQAPD